MDFQDQPRPFIKKPGTLASILISTGAAILLFAFMGLCNKLPFALVFENAIFRLLSTVRYGTSFTTDSLLDKVLFINTGASNMLVPNGSGTGMKVITDRGQLNRLLQRIAKQDIKNKFVIVDLQMGVSTPQDSALAATIAGYDRIYFPTISKEAEGVLATVIRSCKTGYTKYTYVNSWWRLSDILLKYPLAQNNAVKSLPLLVYEDYSGEQAQKRGLLLWSGGRYMFNSIFVDEKIRSYTLDTARQEKFVRSLDLVLTADSLSPDHIPSLLEGKRFIVIGDFLRDRHKTAFGEVPGAVINMNLLGSLMNRQSKVSVLWMLTMLVALSGIVHFSFFGLPVPFFHRTISGFSFFIGDTAQGLLTYSLFFFLLGAVSYYFFNVPIEVMPLVVIMTATFQMIRFMKKIFYRNEFMEARMAGHSVISSIGLVVRSVTFRKILRHILILLVLILLSFLSNAQTYKVASVNNGWAKKLNGQLLKTGDLVNLADRFRISSKKVVIPLIGPGGDVRFLRWDAAGQAAGSKSSELWMMVSKTLRPIAMEKAMEGRSGIIASLFELESYLAQFQEDTSAMLIVDELQMRLSKNAFSEEKKRYFFMRYQYRGESINKRLAFRNDVASPSVLTLVLDTSLLKVDKKPVKLSETSGWQLFYYDEKKEESVLVGDLFINILQLKELREVCLLKPLLGNAFNQAFLQNYLAAVYGRTYDDNMLKKILYSCK